MKIYEGEELIAKKNKLLNIFSVFVPEKPKGKVIVNYIFEIDNNYLLHVKSEINKKEKESKLKF